MIASPFDHIDFSDENSQLHIVNIIVKTFESYHEKNKQIIALETLSQLFSHFSFDLKEFMKCNRLNSSQKTKFLSYLLYGLYYREITLSQLPKASIGKYLDQYFFVLLAEVIGERKLQNIISSTTFRQQLDLIAHCCLHIREGSWRILDLLEKIYKDELEKSMFLKRTRRKYYDAKLLETILIESDQKEITFKSILDQLEEHANKQIYEIMQILPELIKESIAMPVRILEEFTEGNSEIKAPSSPKIQEEKSRILKYAEGAQEKLSQLFSPYRNRNYSFEQVRSLFEMFGLRGQFVCFPITPDPFSPMTEILGNILKFFKEPSRLPSDYIYPLIYFVLSICQELYAYNIDPSKYVSGLNRLCYALVTRGNHFLDLPWFPSVIKGFDEIKQYLIDKKNILLNLKEHPIIIFDQAEAKQFAKNRQFIRRLTKEYDVEVIHLSQEQTVDLAKKLGVAHWIQTTPEGNFGYAGARNCTFFLAPLIYRAFREGKRTFSSIMKMNLNELRVIFDEAVLGKDGKDIILHLGEDDVGILPCNFFADALFAEHGWNLYFYRSSYEIGRGTKQVHSFLDLKSILEEPWIIYSTTVWMEFPQLGGMKGMLTKPRFCLPLPFGNEEAHVMTPSASIDFFQQVVVHLAGARFPDNEIPVTPLEGTEKYLFYHIPYSFQIALSSALVDPSNKSGRCILPWNDDAVRQSDNIHSMGNLWWYISLQETRAELKKRFWRNMRMVFQDQSENVFLRDRIEDYSKFDNTTRNIPDKLKNFYLKIQKDAELFMDFGKLLVHLQQSGGTDYLEKAKKQMEFDHHFKILDNQFTKALFLLVKCIDSFGENLIRFPTDNSSTV